MARTISIFRIFMDFKEDGVIQQSPLSISFKTEEEAKKCVDYLNSKRESGLMGLYKYAYFYKREQIKEYKTAEEYIAEQDQTDNEK